MKMQSQKIKTYKSFCQLLAAVLTYSIGSFYFGYTLGYFNSIHFREIHRIFGIEMAEGKAEGIFSGCVPFGALFGAYCSGYIINRFSRRQSFLLVDVIALSATLLVIMKSTYLLMIGRVMQGFCVGVFSSLVPLMVKQYSPLELSGSFGGLMAPAIGCGFLSAYLLSYVLNKYYLASDFWVVTFGFPALLILAQLILLLKVFVNQTPKYLISHNKLAQARDLLQQIYTSSHVQRILQQKILDLQPNKNNQAYELTNQIETEKQIQAVNQPKNASFEGDIQFNPNTNENENKQILKKVYPPDVRIARILGFFMQAFHQLSGINVIVIYGAHLARQSIPQLTDQIPLIINAQKILAGLFGTILLNKFGRRYLMLRGQLIIEISLIGLSVGFAVESPDSSLAQILIFSSLIVYVSAFVITLGPITWLYIPQIVQPPTVSKTTMLNWILACIIVTVFPIIKNHLMALFLFFAFTNAINLVMCYFLMIQTKGKKEVEIRGEFGQMGGKVGVRVRGWTWRD